MTVPQSWPRRAGAGVPASAISGGVSLLNADILLAKSRIDRFTCSWPPKLNVVLKMSNW